MLNVIPGVWLQAATRNFSFKALLYSTPCAISAKYVPCAIFHVALATILVHKAFFVGNKAQFYPPLSVLNEAHSVGNKVHLYL